MRATASTGNGGTVTALAPSDEIDDRVAGVWLVIGLLALGGVGAALGLGLLQSRHFARPLERLSDAAARLGHGDFSARAGSHALPEIDALGAALDRSAERIAALVERERAFSANVAHQLRTPLTALRLRLEELTDSPEDEVRQEAAAALAQADRLEATVNDLLALARSGRAGDAESIDVGALVRARAAAWMPTYNASARPLVVRAGQGTIALATPGALQQALDVLLENALRHGEGEVSVLVTMAGDHVVIGVGDQGAGVGAGLEEAVFDPSPTPPGGTGLGLPLARALMEAGEGAYALRPLGRSSSRSCCRRLPRLRALPRDPDANLCWGSAELDPRLCRSLTSPCLNPSRDPLADRCRARRGPRRRPGGSRRRDGRQRAAHRLDRAAAAPAAGGRRGDHPLPGAAAARAHLHRHGPHPTGRAQAREHRLPHGPLLRRKPALPDEGTPAARAPARWRRAWCSRRWPSWGPGWPSSSRVPETTPSSHCTRRASSSGSRSPRSTCSPMCCSANARLASADWRRTNGRPRLPGGRARRVIVIGSLLAGIVLGAIVLGYSGAWTHRDRHARDADVPLRAALRQLDVPVSADRG